MRVVSVRGFALIEVLIASLFIVSGVLGISVLFVRALAQARSALYRTTAVYLVDDLAESIRANFGAGVAYADPVDAGAAACANSCSPQAIAASDLAAWSARVLSDLSAAEIPAIEADPSATLQAPDRFRIQVLWHEPDFAEPFSVASDLLLAPRGRVP